MHVNCRDGPAAGQLQPATFERNRRPMIAPGTVALRFETRKTLSGRRAVRCYAVLVAAVIDLGPLGMFAQIREGRQDRRVFARRHEAEPATVDLRELLPLAWLESLTGSRLCVPPSPKRAA